MNKKGPISIFLMTLIIVLVGSMGYLLSTKNINEVFSSITPVDGNIVTASVYNANTTKQIISTGYDTSGLPDCKGSTFLSVAPAKSAEYSLIQPMGNVSSYNGNPGHTLPTDHIYFYLNSDTKGSTLPAGVAVPTNVKILKINSKDYGPNGKDNQIYFASCKQVILMYDHVATLSPKIVSAISSAPHKICDSNYAIGTTKYQQCSYSFNNLSLKAGEQLGVAGGPGTTAMAFDFGIYDYRTTPANFIDPKKLSNLYAVCPLDYYPAGTIKTSLFNKVDNTQKNIYGFPDCGKYMQDKAGTIQGNWYLPNTPAIGPLPDDHLLSIIHKNTDPSLGVIDWGGTIAPADRLEFTTQSNSFINREPSQVTADGQIYCFQNPPYNPRSVILQLIDNNTLKIEYQPNLCTTNKIFSKATTYIR